MRRGKAYTDAVAPTWSWCSHYVAIRMACADAMVIGPLDA